MLHSEAAIWLPLERLQLVVRRASGRISRMLADLLHGGHVGVALFGQIERQATGLLPAF